MTLAELIQAEPRLGALFDYAVMISRSGRVPEDQAWAVLKPALDGLVGWWREEDPGDPELFAPEAYQAAAQALLACLRGSPPRNLTAFQDVASSFDYKKQGFSPVLVNENLWPGD